MDGLFKHLLQHPVQLPLQQPPQHPPQHPCNTSYSTPCSTSCKKPGSWILGYRFFPTMVIATYFWQIMNRFGETHWLIVLAMYKINWGSCNAISMNGSIIRIDERTSENVQQNIIAMMWGNLCNSRVELIRRCSTWQISFPWHFLQGQHLLHYGPSCSFWMNWWSIRSDGP